MQTQSIALTAGHTIRITGDNVVIEIMAQAKRRGPTSLPKATISSKTLHMPIIRLLRSNASLTSEVIRQEVQKAFVAATTNTVAWALVELQNEGAQRGKNRPKTGPVVKNADGSYSIRK